MKYNEQIHSTFHSRSGQEAANVVAAWRQVALFDDSLHKQKIKDNRGILGIGAMSGSGMPYPGVSRRRVSVVQESVGSKEDHRKPPFNFKTDSQES